MLITKRTAIISVLNLAVVVGVAAYVFRSMCVNHWFAPNGDQRASFVGRIEKAKSVRVINLSDFRVIEMTVAEPQYRPIVDATTKAILNRDGYPAAGLARRSVVVFCGDDDRLVMQYNGKHIIIDGFHFVSLFDFQNLFPPTPARGPQ
jgi:hypothetical protein